MCLKWPHLIVVPNTISIVSSKISNQANSHFRKSKSYFNVVRTFLASIRTSKQMKNIQKKTLDLRRKKMSSCERENEMQECLCWYAMQSVSANGGENQYENNKKSDAYFSIVFRRVFCHSFSTTSSVYLVYLIWNNCLISKKKNEMAIKHIFFGF